ncbi:cytochrome P450 [Xylariaceae sp. FL0662B]|nr:cytochrome P450 [Xylariaceae sp. FL0662B]
MLQPLGSLGPIRLALIMKAFGYLALVGLAFFFYRLYQVRMMYRRIKKEHGIPMLPHSFLLGHLPIMAKLSMKYKIPRDAHGQLLFDFLKKEYPELGSQGVIYLDVWPMGYPIMVVCHPGMQSQFTQEHSLPKFRPQSQVEFKDFSGGEDILNLEGQEWRMARSMFNPGFAAKNLLSLIPEFVEESRIFRERLRKAATSGEVVKLEDYTVDLTTDIIGRAVLGTRLETQTRPSPLMETMKAQVALIYMELDIRKLLNPTRRLKHWLYNRRIRNALLPYIRGTIQNYEKIEGPKTVIALALRSYVGEAQSHTARGEIPPEFLDRVVKHIKMFMLAGHDTTATTLAHTYYILSKHPEVAAKLRAEHDEVLGSRPADAADLITADPTLLNKMPYTIAVIKEMLRLYPPVGGTIRESSPGHFLTHPESGVRYPTNGFMMHSSAATVQRDPEYWPDPLSFLPERFLVRDENDPLYPVKNTWRPFELGPRHCIGQELVSLEMRLILALTVREFEVEDAYPENAPTLMGDKAYQVHHRDTPVTAHIKDALPVKVKAR